MRHSLRNFSISVTSFFGHFHAYRRGIHLLINLRFFPISKSLSWNRSTVWFFMNENIFVMSSNCSKQNSLNMKNGKILNKSLRGNIFEVSAITMISSYAFYRTTVFIVDHENIIFKHYSRRSTPSNLKYPQKYLWSCLKQLRHVLWIIKLERMIIDQNKHVTKRIM